MVLYTHTTTSTHRHHTDLYGCVSSWCIACDVHLAAIIAGIILVGKYTIFPWQGYAKTMLSKRFDHLQPRHTRIFIAQISFPQRDWQIISIVATFGGAIHVRVNVWLILPKRVQFVSSNNFYIYVRKSPAIVFITYFSSFKIYSNNISSKITTRLLRSV